MTILRSERQTRPENWMCTKSGNRPRSAPLLKLVQTALFRTVSDTRGICHENFIDVDFSILSSIRFDAIQEHIPCFFAVKK